MTRGQSLGKRAQGGDPWGKLGLLESERSYALWSPRGWRGWVGEMGHRG